MIKLTFSPEKNPITRTFTKSCVVIGNGSNADCDIVLPDESLEHVHLKINELNGQYIVINQANDPFVTLNGMPFGKKTLRSNDVLQVGNTRMRVELCSSANGEPASSPNIHDTTHAIPKIVEKLIDPPVAQDPFHLVSSEPIDASALMDEVEHLAMEKVLPPVPEPLVLQKKSDEASTLAAPYQIKVIKETEVPFKKKNTEYFLSEFDEENENWKFEKEEKPVPEEPKKTGINWKLIIGIIVTLAFVFAAIGTSLYMRVSDKSGEEENKAAEGVSDVAMALTYARINHIKPQKHNWSDPDFLKNNLAAVLTSDYPSLANIDKNGQFCNCNYILRIYTSSDFNHFIVIAQPAPSLKQWLIPKDAIVVDSKLMELRKVGNLKALNRLLVNPNVLDDDGGEDVTQLIRDSELIPLAHLAARKKDKWFSPPKALILIRPGAQNLIYNAPRYYHLGEGLIKRALNLMENPGSSHDISRLKQEIEMMSNLPNMVLYAAWGIQNALDVQRALATFAPQGKFLTAYFQYNAKDEIIGSHLLMDDENEHQLAFAKSETPKTDQLDVSKEEETAPVPMLPSDYDEEHPLIYQLQALSNARQAALKPLGDEMITLIKQNNEGVLINFGPRFHKLVDEYEKRSRDQQEIIVKELNQLYHEYRHMPVNQLIVYVKATGLEGFIKEVLKSQAAKLGKSILTPAQIEQQLQKIQNATNFENLDEAVAESADLLNLERLPDLEMLIPYQTTMRSLVLQKLNIFLLAPESALSQISFTADDRESLAHILKLIWMNEQEEYDFYLNEFDLLSQEKEGKAST
jgi:hypothetical protein